MVLFRCVQVSHVYCVISKVMGIVDCYAIV